MNVPPSHGSVVSFDFKFTLKLSKQEVQLYLGSRGCKMGSPPFSSQVAVANRPNKSYNKPLMPIAKGNYLPLLSFGVCPCWHGHTGLFIIPETTECIRSSSFQLNQDFLHESLESSFLLGAEMGFFWLRQSGKLSTVLNFHS